MGHDNDRYDGPDSEREFGDLRESERFTLLIRSAKLICDSGEFLCIVRDVSRTGVRLRLFHPLPAGEHLALELASGDTYLVEKVWMRGDQAGFRFAAPIELRRFVHEAGPYPKRPLRLRLHIAATITTNGTTSTAMVRDISQQGARIDTSRLLAARQTLQLDAEGLPPLSATVCWRSRLSYGLVLQPVFAFEELARLAARLQSEEERGERTEASARRPAGTSVRRH